jgi:hypothetical protein
MMNDPAQQEPFDYSTLDEQTREIILRKTDETRGLMMRTTEHIIAIGFNLLTVRKQLPEMKFSAWLRTEFALSRQSAYNFMKVASKFGGRCNTVLQLPASVLYELASSSEAIVEQVEAGQLPPTLDAIRAGASESLEGEHERHVRLNWYRITSEFQRSMRSILSQWPSPLDALVFEADDWTRLSHVRELARRFLEECALLAQGTSGRIVEGSRVSSEGVCVEQGISS